MALDVDFPQAQALVERLAKTIHEPLDAIAAQTLRSVAAPTLDMVTTPLGARASLLGARVGKDFYHHELRRRLPMPPELEPEVEVWEHGTAPVWRDGVLIEPKYFSFFQDAPFAALNPNHRRKWRAQELLHGALGFFWRPDMDRFEFYLGARLAELLPVVHWYGFDEIFRPRCGEHLGARLGRAYCADCESLARPYWEQDPRQTDALQKVALQFATSGLEHLNHELELCRRERLGGERLAEPRADGLDASSDAVGYLKGHWNRCTAWSFGSWVEMFCRAGVDYHETNEAMERALVELAAEMLDGRTLTIDEQALPRLRARRKLQDVGYRLLLALEWLDPDSAQGARAEQVLMPWVERAADHAQTLLYSQQTSALLEDLSLEAPASLERQLRAELSQELTQHDGLLVDSHQRDLLALGYAQEPLAAASWDQLMEGLEQAAPRSWAARTRPGAAIEPELFEGSDWWRWLGTLTQRVERLFDEQEHPLHALARFEAGFRAQPLQDEDAELFAALPPGFEALDLSRCRRNRSWRVLEVDPQLCDELFGGAEQVERIVVFFFGGEPRLLPLDDALEELMARFDRGEIEAADWGSLQPLLAHGALVYLPLPASQG